MKKILLSFSALAAMLATTATFSACSSDDEQQSSATLSLNAVKGDYGFGTRSISYVDASDVTKGINTTWATSDKVAVYKSGWSSKIGDLSPIAEKTEGNKTKLDGNVASDGLNIGDRTELIMPRTTWSYTDQDGTIGTISSKFDYAIASAQVTFIDQNKKIYASDAIFKTQQAIVRYIFNYGSDNSKKFTSLTIVAESGKLVKTRSLDGSSVEYGGLEVKPSNATNIFDVALRNDNTDPDKYTLTVKDEQGKIYSSTSTKPHSYAWGKFIIHEVNVAFVDDTHTERDTYQYQGTEEW